MFIYVMVEHPGEYRCRHEWLLASQDVAQEQTFDIKSFISNLIHRKWILLIAEITIIIIIIIIIFIYVIIFKIRYIINVRTQIM